MLEIVLNRTGLMRVGLLLLALCICHTGSLRGQDAQDTKETVASTLRDDRVSRSHLSAARELIAAKEYGAALDHLQQALDAGSASLVLDDKTYRSTAFEANRLIGALPAPALELYERQFGEAARTALQEVDSTSSLNHLRDVSVRFRHTSAGLNALQRLAERQLDAGHFSAAAAVFREAITHRLKGGNPEARLVAMWLLCWQRCGARAADAAWIESTSDSFKDQVITLGGREQPLQDWLSGNSSNTIVQAGFDGPANIGVPSAHAVWQTNIGPNEALATLMNEGLVEAESQGVPLIGNSLPVSVGDMIVARGLEGIFAIELKTGEIRWRQEYGTKRLSAETNSRRLLNDSYRDLMRETLSRRWLAQSIEGRVSTDGTRCFAIVNTGSAIDGLEHLVPTRPRRLARAVAESALGRNSLIACDLITGERLWEVEAVVPETVGRDKPMNAFFCGTPLVHESQLYVVGRTDSVVQLFVLDPRSGEIVWTVPLCDADSSTLQSNRGHEIDRSCTVAARDGMMLCTTGCGVVVGVDVSTRSLRWAVPLTRDDGVTTAALAPRRWSRRSSELWWEGWKDSAIVAANGRSVFVTPESDSIQAIDSTTGELLWQQPRDEGIYLASSEAGHVVVVEKFGVRRLDPTTGETAWNAIVGKPAGIGCYAEDNYFLPLAAGGIATIRIRDGHTTRTFRDESSVRGNLLLTSAGVLSQSASGLALHRDLSEWSSQVTNKLQDEPENRHLHKQVALLSLERGELDSGITTLMSLYELERDESTRQILRTAFQRLISAAPQRADELSQRIEPLLNSEGERLEWCLARSDAKAAAGDVVAAWQLLLDGLDFDADDELEIGGLPGRRVRFDKVLAGRINDMLRKVDAAKRTDLEAIARRRWKDFGAKSDVERRERWLAAFSAENVFIDERIAAARTSAVSGLLVGQLELLRLAGVSDPATAMTAQQTLIEIAIERRDWITVAAMSQSVLTRWKNAQTTAQKTTVSTFESFLANENLARWINADSLDRWPAVEPVIQVDEREGDSVDFAQLPVISDRNSICDRLTVLLDTDLKRIRFQGAGHSGYWELALPERSSPMRVTGPLQSAWGIGRLLLVRLGTELLGIEPIDRNGEPNAKLVWHFDTTSDAPPNWNNISVQVVPERIGFGPDRYVFSDRFERALGQVGPVRPGYLCFQDKAHLIAVETATGRRLWQRNELPAGSVCSGDDDFVFLLRPESRVVQIVRALDGQDVGTRELEVTAREILVQHGRFAVIEQADPAAFSLRCVDIVTGEVEWHRRFDRVATPFAIDGRSLGIVERGEDISFLSLADGQTIASYHLELPRQLSGIYATYDEGLMYVAFSGPFGDERALRANRDHSLSFRNPPVNGVLCAFRRDDGRHLWTTNLENGALLLEQPRESPFMVLSYWTPDPTTDDGQLLAVAACLDKRTGNTVYEQKSTQILSLPTVELSPNLHRVELRTADKVVRFQYPAAAVP